MPVQVYDARIVHFACHLQSNTSNRHRRRFSAGTSRIRNIMSAILLTAGPVTSNVSFQRRAPTSLRQTSKDLFHAAANMLQAAHFGIAIRMMNSSRPSVAFVKNPPQAVAQTISENRDLITMDRYTERYYVRTPTCVTIKMREKLLTMGLLTQEQANISLYGTAGPDFNLNQQGHAESAHPDFKPMG